MMTMREHPCPASTPTCSARVGSPREKNAGRTVAPPIKSATRPTMAVKARPTSPRRLPWPSTIIPVLPIRTSEKKGPPLAAPL